MKSTILNALTCVLGLTLAVTGELQAQQAAAPARLSDNVNERLPSWLRIGGEYRMRFEGIDSMGFRPETDDAFVLSRLRLNTTFTPAPWFKAYLQGQDAQVMARNAKPDGPPFEDTFDLRQAYVELGNLEANTFGVRMGRQEMVFGDQRLVGHVAWLNTARSFDAVRATFRHRLIRVDAFASTVVNPREGRFNSFNSSGNNFHGIYTVLGTIVPNGAIEPYGFWRVAGGVMSETGAAGKLDAKTIGVRWAGKLPASLDYNMEMAGQTGSVSSDDVSAWAGHWLIGYTVSAPYAPRIVAEYNYASGDADPADGRRETFDQLYPTGHDKYGLADQVGWKNIHAVRTGVELKPSPRLSISNNYHSWWLASTTDGLYNAGSALVARDASGNAGRHVGYEADIQATFAVNSQIQVSAGYAHIFPGTFLKNATPGEQFKSSFLMLNYLF